MNDNNNIGKIIINEDTIKTMKDLHGIDALAEAKRAVEHEAAKEDRQVFFIDIGDVPPQEVQTYLDKIKSDIKDRQSAGAYNPLDMKEDYFFGYPASAFAPKKKFLSTKTFGNDRGLSCCFRQWRSTHSHCSQVHGYSIGVKFVFECDTLDERNWVMDFGGLKGVKQWLEYMFDHTMAVAEDDPLLPMWQQMAENPETAHAINLRVVPAVGCERFAELVFDHVTKLLDDTRNELLNPTVRLKSVEVFEHGANSAICERN
jgi:6-pyruvoyltetrahydropterin/6-carboxytetrahydropterin synthase